MNPTTPLSEEIMEQLDAPHPPTPEFVDTIYGLISARLRSGPVGACAIGVPDHAVRSLVARMLYLNYFTANGSHFLLDHEVDQADIMVQVHQWVREANPKLIEHIREQFNARPAADEDLRRARDARQILWSIAHLPFAKRVELMTVGAMPATVITAPTTTDFGLPETVPPASEWLMIRTVLSHPEMIGYASRASVKSWLLIRSLSKTHYAHSVPYQTIFFSFAKLITPQLYQGARPVFQTDSPVAGEAWQTRYRLAPIPEQCWTMPRSVSFANGQMSVRLQDGTRIRQSSKHLDRVRWANTKIGSAELRMADPGAPRLPYDLIPTLSGVREMFGGLEMVEGRLDWFDVDTRPTHLKYYLWQAVNDFREVFPAVDFDEIYRMQKLIETYPVLANTIGTLWDQMLEI